MAKPKRTPREQAELDMMNWLNDNNMQYMWGSRAFDFGSLGVLQVWWQRQSWQIKWLEVEKPPEGVKYG